jgi:hypothetical protein
MDNMMTSPNLERRMQVPSGMLRVESEGPQSASWVQPRADALVMQWRYHRSHRSWLPRTWVIRGDRICRIEGCKIYVVQVCGVHFTIASGGAPLGWTFRTRPPPPTTSHSPCIPQPTNIDQHAHLHQLSLSNPDALYHLQQSRRQDTRQRRPAHTMPAMQALRGQICRA